MHRRIAALAVTVATMRRDAARHRVDRLRDGPRLLPPQPPRQPGGVPGRRERRLLTTLSGAASSSATRSRARRACTSCGCVTDPVRPDGNRPASGRVGGRGRGGPFFVNGCGSDGRAAVDEGPPGGGLDGEDGAVGHLGVADVDGGEVGGDFDAGSAVTVAVAGLEPVGAVGPRAGCAARGMSLQAVRQAVRPVAGCSPRR